MYGAIGSYTRVECVLEMFSRIWFVTNLKTRDARRDAAHTGCEGISIARYLRLRRAVPDDDIYFYRSKNVVPHSPSTLGNGPTVPGCTS